jgi:hypothetical protein
MMSSERQASFRNWIGTNEYHSGVAAMPLRQQCQRPRFIQSNRGRFLFVPQDGTDWSRAMEQAKKKVVIKKTAAIIVNTGGYENLSVSQTIEAEIEYDGIEELKKKDGNLTLVLDILLKKSTEETLKQTNRKRVIGNQPVELW